MPEDDMSKLYMQVNFKNRNKVIVGVRPLLHQVERS